MGNLAIVYSRALLGLEAELVEIEAHLSNGLPQFHIVGLPEAEVKESRDRVRAAILQSGLCFPAKKIVINLAPAELPKESGRFDLPIAISILIASQQVSVEPALYEFAGELALSGQLRAVRGDILLMRAALQANRTLILPKSNQANSRFFPNAPFLFAETLTQIVSHLNQVEKLIPPPPYDIPSEQVSGSTASALDISDINGQQTAKKALEIAAAGGHNLLLVGPPGTGKSMLANRLPSILPPLTREESMENAMIASIVKSSQAPIEQQERPFRNPHHTASTAAIIGGGSQARPGEITLAHNGVLFLDELSEFPRPVLEALREPLETKSVHVSRVAVQTTYPANFQLIATMNPCPCGFHGHPLQNCHCTPEQIKRYQSKLSGPLLDRIDLIVQVPPLSPKQLLTNSAPLESSREIKKRVIKSRELQYNRQGGLNCSLTSRALEDFAQVEEEARSFLLDNLVKLGLSVRSFHKILKVARTVADLGSLPKVNRDCVLKAVNFRRI
ncbi:MAG: YifB family Mg chelatase-like AAA ATPase [Neisseriaceae bacterium]